MTDEHTPSTGSESTEPKKHRTPAWMRGRKAVVAGVTALALAGGWALSSTPAARAAHKQADSLSNQLDAVSTHLQGLTSDHPSQCGARNGAPQNTTPTDAAIQRALDGLVTKNSIPS